MEVAHVFPSTLGGRGSFHCWSKASWEKQQLFAVTALMCSSHGVANLLLAGCFRLCDPEQDQDLFPSGCSHIYPWSCSRLTLLSAQGAPLWTGV